MYTHALRISIVYSNFLARANNIINFYGLAVKSTRQRERESSSGYTKVSTIIHVYFNVTNKRLYERQTSSSTYIETLQ